MGSCSHTEVYFIFINNHVYNLNQSYTNSLSADNKPRIVYLLAKNCSDKSKLKRLQDKYRKKQNKVCVREWSYFTMNRAGDPRMLKLPLRGKKKCFFSEKKKKTKQKRGKSVSTQELNLTLHFS